MQFRPGPATSAGYVKQSIRAGRILKVAIACTAVGLAGLVVGATGGLAAPLLLPHAAAGVVAKDSFLIGAALFVLGGTSVQVIDIEMRAYEKAHGIKQGLFTRIQQERHTQRRRAVAGLN